MKTVRSPLAAAALLVALAGSAFAQTPPAAPATPPASGMPMMRHGHDHGPRDSASWQQRHERRLADLKQALQLTPAQEPAWNQFTAAMKPPATPPQRPDHEAMAKLPTPERIDRMRALRQQHQAEMDRRADATKAFYAQLSPEQKKRFDEQSAKMMSQGKRGHHDHDHHGMHHGH